ncbi:MAG: hypothetical protein AABZ53_13500 [Planctomycetota bacterium]
MRPAAILVSLSCLCTASFADNTATLDLTGVQLRNATNQSRSSTPDTMDPGCTYTYHIDGMVRGRGTFSLLSILFPSPTPLAQAMETLSPGSSAFLNGTVVSPTGGTHPAVLMSENLAGSQVVLGTTINFAATFTVGVDAANHTYFTLTNVTISPSATVGYLEFTSGAATTTSGALCPADFNGDCTIDFFDYDDFVRCFEGEGCPPGKSADFDGDGAADFFDYDAFVVAFSAGCG